MPLKFSNICDLLGDLETVETREVPFPRRDYIQVTRKVIESWFKKHRTTLDTPSANSVAILSTLFPEQRTDRVYGLQDNRLSYMLARCLFLSSENTKRIQEYRQPGRGDLANCIERILRVHDGNPRLRQSVLVDEVDSWLGLVASRCRFSSLEVRKRSSDSPIEKALSSLLGRMTSKEVKWLTRLILKDFSPVNLDFSYVISSYHFLLPGLLRFQNSFESAIGMLKGPLARYHAQPDQMSQLTFKREAALLVRPRIGVQVGRPVFHKARSIQHCLKLAGGKRWSVERKYDGEYCEVHINLACRKQQIQIFSKSGKDSTSDRGSLLPTLRECFGLGTSHCQIKKQCIVLGELVVYSDETGDILPFHNIRKHVSRSGVFLGAEQYSPRREHEHLMIILFDVLLLDDQVCLTNAHLDRRRLLHSIVHKIPGRAMTSEWRTIDLSKESAVQDLLHHFVASIALRHEGLLLKPANAPYFSLLDDEPGTWHSGFIKLKKDYIQALGEERDVADLVVIGASYNARQANRTSVTNLQYTAFHLGCLINSSANRSGSRPSFLVVATIGSDHSCIPGPELQALNNIARFHARTPPDINSDSPGSTDGFLIEPNGPNGVNMDAVLDSPVVVEVLGSGFEKPPTKGFFMLRHPRILKVHLDRNWSNSTNFDDLQSMAQSAQQALSEGDPEATIQLLDKLQRKMQRKADRGDLWSPVTPRSPALTRSPVSSRSPLSRRSDCGNGAHPASVVPSSPSMRTAKIPYLSRAAVSDALSQEHGKRDDNRNSKMIHVGSGEPHSPKLVTNRQHVCSAPASEQIDYNRSYQALQSHRGEMPHKRRPSGMDTDSEPSIKRTKRKRDACLIDAASTGERTASALGKSIEIPGPFLRDRLEASPFRSPPGQSLDDMFLCPDWVPRATTDLSCQAGPRCRWAQTVFVLSPCVANMPLLTEDLIPRHGGRVVDNNNLECWVRRLGTESSDHGILFESQSDPGMQKVILIESSRPTRCYKMVEKVRSLCITEPIDFWDWRVLELPCKSLRLDGESQGLHQSRDDLVIGYYFGRYCSSIDKREAHTPAALFFQEAFMKRPTTAVIR